MIAWRILDSRATLEHLGLIPMFLIEADPRPAREQFDDRYRHGGGWNATPGFKFNPVNKTLKYPDDQSLHPLAEAKLRDEVILLYESAWVLVLQLDGAYEVARLD